MEKLASESDSVMIRCKSHYERAIDALYLCSDLLENSHFFSHRDFNVEVRIPSSDETRKLRVAALHVVDGKDVPTIYHVKSIDIYITIPNDIKCINTEDTNNVNPNHKITGCDPNELLSELTNVSIDAYKYWVDIVRLQTHDYQIGLRLRGATSHDSASIVDGDSEKKICSGPITITSRLVDKGINKDTWNRIQSNLSQKIALPVHYQFLIDAIHALQDKRLKSCIIDLAIACEIYLRYSVFEVLGECPLDVKSKM